MYKAGKELDELIAKEIFGLIPCEKRKVRTMSYSTDIAAAWQVVEELLKKELGFYLYTSHGEWICELEIYYVDDDEALVLEGAETPELAICRAALEAKGR